MRPAASRVSLGYCALPMLAVLLVRAEPRRGSRRRELLPSTSTPATVEGRISPTAVRPVHGVHVRGHQARSPRGAASQPQLRGGRPTSSGSRGAGSATRTIAIDDYGVAVRAGRWTWRIRCARRGRAVGGALAAGAGSSRPSSRVTACISPASLSGEVIEYRGYLWIKAGSASRATPGWHWKQTSGAAASTTRRESRTSRATGRSIRSR